MREGGQNLARITCKHQQIRFLVSIRACPISAFPTQAGTGTRSVTIVGSTLVQHREATKAEADWVITLEWDAISNTLLLLARSGISLSAHNLDRAQHFRVSDTRKTVPLASR
jgi:hypothetical protein